jgi:hypothetical protein
VPLLLLLPLRQRQATERGRRRRRKRRKQRKRLWRRLGYACKSADPCCRRWTSSKRAHYMSLAAQAVSVVRTCLVDRRQGLL